MRERLGRYSWTGGDTANALAAYEEAVRIDPRRASVRRARQSRRRAGHAQFVSCRYRIARERCAEGLEIARAVGARVEEGRALAILGAATAAWETPSEGCACSARVAHGSSGRMRRPTSSS